MRGVDVDARGSGNVTAIAGHGPSARVSDALEGAVALKQEAQHDLSPTEKLEAMQWSKAGSAAVAVAPSKAERRAEAKAKGYEGEMCGEVRQLHAGAERDLHEVRYVWQHDGVFVATNKRNVTILGQAALLGGLCP